MKSGWTMALVPALALSGCAAINGCPKSASELPPEALYGRWQARVDGMPGVATLELAPHPDYAGVRGTMTRSDAMAGSSIAQLAGDIDDAGLLALDESVDGRAISGVWSGELQASSCGTEFRGVRRDASDDSTQAFVMTKTDSPR